MLVIFFWGGAAIVTIVALSALVMSLRRRFLNTNSAGSAQVFTLQDLRDMHARGDLTDDEYERMRTRLIDSLRSAAPSAAFSHSVEKGDSERLD